MSQEKKPEINEQTVKAMAMEMMANEITARTNLVNRLLNPQKDIEYSCGYPDSITTQDYRLHYDREGVGTRVVHILPEESWKMPPDIYETEENNETEFERVLKEIDDAANLMYFMELVDILSGIGRFGILLLGIDDGKDLSEPVEGIDPDTGRVIPGPIKRQLLYLRAFDEYNVDIGAIEQNTASPRFSMPKMYNVNFENSAYSSSTDQKRQTNIHWSRVVHIADNRTTSSIYGTPRMKPIYNRLLDIRKIISGSGEMYWRGAFPGMAFELMPEAAGSSVDAESLKSQMQKYTHGLQRYIMMSGFSAKSLTPQVVSPKEYMESQLNVIAMVLGVPLRIFMGSEQAQLASGQDKDTWNERLDRRRKKYLTPLVIRPIIQRLVDIKVLPQPQDLFIQWPDIDALGEKDKSEIAKNTTESLAKYVGGGIDAMIPPIDYLIHILDMDKEKAQAILKNMDEILREETEQEEDLSEEE